MNITGEKSCHMTCSKHILEFFSRYFDSISDPNSIRDPTTQFLAQITTIKGEVVFCWLCMHLEPHLELMTSL